MTSGTDHPLCLALRSCLDLNDGAGAGNLQALLECNKVHSVATYVVTHDGESLYMHKPGDGKKTKLLRAFGGCNFPNNLICRLNSLRLELMDEGSILWSGELDVINSTPVLIARHPEHEGGLILLQAAQLAKPRLGEDQRYLFSFDAARQVHGDKLPADLELALEAAPMLPDEFKATVVRHSFQTVDVHGAQNMRKVDHESLLKMRPLIEDMLSPNPSRENFIAEEGNENAQKLVDLVTSLEPIAKMARLPWKPLLWSEALILRSFDTTMAVVAAAGSSRPAELPSDELFDWLGAPTEKDFDKGKCIAQSLWIPVHEEVLCKEVVPAHRFNRFSRR